MKVNEVSFDQLQVNDKVKSDNTGRIGTITNKYPQDDIFDSDRITIKWEGHGGVSPYLPARNLCKVEYIGQSLKA